VTTNVEMQTHIASGKCGDITIQQLRVTILDEVVPFIESPDMTAVTRYLGRCELSMQYSCCARGHNKRENV
jgi:hypothetical protein